LSLPEVLRLFRTVCDAVQYAHSRLIVHRDIKPGNVLVDASGRIKLLDFGIAKQLTTDGGNQTRVGHAAFTPDFASPEQLLGESVTTASDVYSLGVLLFSLLTGAPPHDVRSARPAEVVELATRVTAPRLAQRWVASTGSWSGAFSEDLESILAKALEKEVARRYQSAHELSEDLRRYLEGLPVLARPNSWRYRAAKFVRRHRVGVSAAVAVGLVLMGTTLIALQQLSVARVERDRAARANEFLFDVLLSPSSGVQSSIAGGVDLTVMELLALLPDEIQSRFADDPEEQMRMLNAIGLAQLDSGRYKEGERVVRMAERLAECCIDGLSPSRPYLLNLQFVLARELDPESAGAYIEEAVALREQVSGLPEFINVGILHNYGLYLLEAGRLDEAETFIRRAIAANGNPRNAQLKGLLAVGLGNLSFVARSKGEYVAALDLVRRSIAVFEDLGEVTTQEHVFQYHNMSQLEWRLGNYEAGLEHSRRAMLELDRITGGDHPYLFLMMSNYALHLLATGLFDEAREVFAKAEAAVALPKEHYLRLNLYLVGGELALLSMDAGRARELFESGIRLYKSHKRLDVEALSWLLSGSGLAEYLAGNTELAVQKTRSALELVGVDRARNSPAATIFEKRLNCMQLSLPKATCMVQGVRRIGEADVPSGIERAQQLAELNEREIET
ncbi:MAG: serine/threonine protein kinase, partial [Pseudomonadales bacterium]|nr:serine/threonine protein kinase [Pseudomonadales bacterium]